MIQFPVKSDNHAFLLLCNFPRWLAYCYSFRGNVFNSPSQTSVQYSRWCLSDIKKGWLHGCSFSVIREERKWGVVVKTRARRWTWLWDKEEGLNSVFKREAFNWELTPGGGVRFTHCVLILITEITAWSQKILDDYYVPSTVQMLKTQWTTAKIRGFHIWRDGGGTEDSGQWTEISRVFANCPRFLKGIKLGCMLASKWSRETVSTDQWYSTSFSLLPAPAGDFLDFSSRWIPSMIF